MGRGHPGLPGDAVHALLAHQPPHQGRVVAREAEILRQHVLVLRHEHRKLIVGGNEYRAFPEAASQVQHHVEIGSGIRWIPGRHLPLPAVAGQHRRGVAALVHTGQVHALAPQAAHDPQPAQLAIENDDRSGRVGDESVRHFLRLPCARLAPAPPPIRPPAPGIRPPVPAPRRDRRCDAARIPDRAPGPTGAGSRHCGLPARC